MASLSGGKCGAIFGDDDYLALDKFSVRLDRGVSSEEGTFTLCFWVYLLKCSKPGILIRQVFPDSSAAKPFLTIEADRKLTLHPLLLASVGTADEATEDAIIIREAIVADQTCAMEKWVHIGCEIGPDVARLHVNGGVVGERKVDCFKSKGNGGNPLSLLLAGGEGSLDGNCVQGYAHHVRVLPQPTVTNHYVKNPPLELCLDGSTGAPDDHEVEEGGDGVWSVVGGKASCRRNFALDVALLDALGRSIHKEMELVAMLVYADNGIPVEKPKDDAEAPLLTTFDGVEFPSTERPIKLMHGRASFKLKISQLSSKCDNRLFRVCFDSPNTPHYPFLRAFSRPIRCVSRNRNHRIPAGVWKQKPNITVFPQDGIGSTVDEEMMATGELVGNGETVCNGVVNSSVNIQGSPFLPGQPSSKRLRTTTSDKILNDGILAENSSERMGLSIYGDVGASPLSVPFHRPLPPKNFPAERPFAWSLHLPAKLPFSRTPVSMDMGFIHGGSRDDDHIVAESLYLSKLNQDNAIGVTDFLVFKYCLENVHCRAEFLKRLISNKSDPDLLDFARRVSDITGCRHNGFQVLMARRLLVDGDDLWSILSDDGHPVLWLHLVKHLEESFGKISGCQTRLFSNKDKEFLRQIAGCGEHASRDEFDRLWQWIYPISVSLSSPQLQSTWESEDPKWIEGMICRKDAETLLKANEAFSSKPGNFLLRFASSRMWPHPDAGALVVSYVGRDMIIYHKLLTLDLEIGQGQGVSENHQHKPLSEVLLLQPELSQLCRVSSSDSGEPANGTDLQDASLDCQEPNIPE